MNREDAIEVKDVPGFEGGYDENGEFKSGIEKAVEYLQECKRNGENVYVNYKGHKLYSCDVTVDSAYVEITGMTKDELERTSSSYVQAKTPGGEREIKEEIERIRDGHRLGTTKKPVKSEGNPENTPNFKGGYDENGEFKSGIDKVVEYLKECERNGRKNLSVEYKGHTICSGDTKADAIYKMTGLTIEQFNYTSAKMEKAQTLEAVEAIKREIQAIRAENKKQNADNSVGDGEKSVADGEELLNQVIEASIEGGITDSEINNGEREIEQQTREKADDDDHTRGK